MDGRETTRRTALLLCWGLGAAALLFAGRAEALTARALVDRNEITAQDVLTLTVVVGDGDGKVDTSPIRDFDVEDEGRTSSVQIINTQISREVRYRYALSPRRTGTLRIPSLVVRSGREEARTDPITVVVTKKSANPGTAPDLDLAARVSVPSAYVGQEIVYTLQVSAAVPLLKASYQAPSFDGFTATPVKKQATRRVVRNGREITVTEISYLLTPQKVGVLRIGPAVLSCQVAASDGGQGGGGPDDPFAVFRDPFFQQTPVEQKILRSAPITVEVRPLPPAPSAGGFSGLVGTFSLSAAVSPSSLSAGQSATVTLILEGTGNVEDAPAPAVAPPSSFKVYPDNPEVQVSHTAQGIRGTKRFRYAVVPTEAGAFQLGPFRLTTFDPDEGRYRTLTAGPLALRVRPGAAPPTAVPPVPPAAVEASAVVRKHEVKQTGHDILALHQGLDALETRGTMGTATFLAFLLAPALLYGAARISAAARRRQPTPAQQMERRARDLLVQARALGPSADARQALGLIHRAVTSAVLARSGRAGEALTYDEAREVLQAASVPPDAAEQTVALLGRIDAGRYGGDLTEDGRRALLREAEAVVGALRKGAPR